MAIRICTATILTLGLMACGSPDTAEQVEAPMASPTVDAAGAERAVAVLRTADGTEVGTATATTANGGVMIALDARAMPPGPHGAHVHMTGQCDAPTFESAGGHWNPANQQHGLEDPAGQHAGDMPNLVIGQDGSGTLQYQLEGGTFEGLLDADGSALVVHADADDQITDPSGDSGERIACGVFERQS